MWLPAYQGALVAVQQPCILKHAASGLARVQRTPQMRTTRFILGRMIYVVMTIKPSCQSCMLRVMKAEVG